MGNLCMPVAPRGLRSSFSRKNSLQGKEKKWTYLFGNESGQEKVTSGEKILQYIPAKDIVAPEGHRESADQKFLSIFRKGKKKTVVRNMGQMMHYSKVKFKFQHCQEVNDCYLELFQAHLYFQSHSPKGLTYQGLLPLKDLSIYKMETASQEEHAFRITGPSLNPLIVYCASQQELHRWLYHLEKQIQLNGGGADPHFNMERQSNGSLMQTAELRWSVQNLPVQNWEGTQRESLGDVSYVSKVTLQHLPFQEQHERLLILYPETLVILSEEQGGLYFRGELPLRAVQVTPVEGERPTRSFLIEGRLINTIRVTCTSPDDFQDWMDYIHSAKFQNSDSSCSGSEGFTRSRSAHYGQPSSSGRSSLASQARSNSWTSGKRGPRHSNGSHGSHGSSVAVERQSFAILNEHRLQQDPLSPGYAEPVQALGSSNWVKVGAQVPAELKRGGSTRGSKGRPGLQIQLPPQPADQTRNCFGLILETPREDLVSPIYNEPYSSQEARLPMMTYHPKCDDAKRWSLAESQCSTSSSISEKELPPLPKSPLYAEPYTVNVQPSYPRFLDETVTHQSQPLSQKANVGSRPFPGLPASHPALQSKLSLPQHGNPRPEPSAPHRYSEPHALHKNLSSRDEVPRPQRNKPGLSSDCKPCPLLSEHEYTELQGFRCDVTYDRDFPYDNVWDESQNIRYSPEPYRRVHHMAGQGNMAKIMTKHWS